MSGQTKVSVFNDSAEPISTKDISSNNDSNSKLPSALRAFRHRNYRLFFFGQLISLSGTWMQSVAQSWLVYKLTGSPVLLGFVGFSGQIPVFLLAPIGGAIADRYDRHRILIFTQTAAMILAFVLALLTLTIFNRSLARFRHRRAKQ